MLSWEGQCKVDHYDVYHEVNGEMELETHGCGNDFVLGGSNEIHSLCMQGLQIYSDFRKPPGNKYMIKVYMIGNIEETTMLPYGMYGKVGTKFQAEYGEVISPKCPADLCKVTCPLKLSEISLYTQECASTANPSVSPTTNPTSSYPKLSRPDQACRSEIKNLGTSFKTAEQCIAAAKSDSRCTGSEIMWSSSYNYAWGCRCCSETQTCPAATSDYYSNSNWDTYEYRTCQTIPENVTPNKGCRYQSKYLGTSFSTPEQCMAAAKSDSGCTGGEIMWSDSYNYAWGCRCCSKHPTCPPGSSRYQSNNNWDVYKYEECS